jgi:hypothetical protein
MPVGANESMYYISANGRNGTPNTLAWYRPGGRTADFGMYKAFLGWQLDENAVRDGYDYFIIHDDKGAQSDPDWPRRITEVDAWIQANLGNGGAAPEPPTPEPPPPTETLIYYDHLIAFGYELVLQRPPHQEGIDAYTPWFRECYAEPERECMTPFLDVLARSDEYQQKNRR